jgi:hypothetical protein
VANTGELRSIGQMPVTIRCGYSNLKSYQRTYSLGLQAGGFPINETKNHCRELGNVYTK